MSLGTERKCERVEAYIKSIIKEVVDLRREFHQYPELGLEEYKTSERVESELRKIGLNTEKMHHTGIVATIKGKYEGPVLLYRTDMDGLPIKEETGLSFASRNEGVMHACGHDLHMACAVGTARVIHHFRDRLHGSVRFMFQPCEERQPGGAKQMIEAGVLENPQVDAAIGMHVTPDVEAGHFFALSGGVTSSPSWFEITITGKGGHASCPEQCIDPIKAGHYIYGKISRLGEIYRKKRAVISVTMFHGGEVQNVIPETCQMAGTVRTFSSDKTEMIRTDLMDVCAEAERFFGVKVDISFRTSMNSVYNHPDMAERMKRIICRELGSDALETDPWVFMGGEDFAEISDRVPAFFLFSGVGGKENSPKFPLHNPRFYADENMLEPAIRVISRFLLTFYLPQNRL